MTFLLYVSIALIVLMLACIARMLLGPATPDRLVALDTTSTLAVSVLIVLGALLGQSIFIDVAIVYAIISFVGTLYFAKYLEDKK